MILYANRSRSFFFLDKMKPSECHSVSLSSCFCLSLFYGIIHIAMNNAKRIDWHFSTLCFSHLAHHECMEWNEDSTVFSMTNKKKKPRLNSFWINMTLIFCGRLNYCISYILVQIYIYTFIHFYLRFVYVLVYWYYLMCACAMYAALKSPTDRKSTKTYFQRQ